MIGRPAPMSTRELYRDYVWWRAHYCKTVLMFRDWYTELYVFKIRLPLWWQP